MLVRSFARRAAFALAVLALLPSVSGAAGGESPIDSGDTAWLLMSTALVLFMMIPGLSLFYAGLVRSRNVLSILMQCYALTCVMSILWLACGYSLSFSGSNGIVGDLQLAFLSGVGPDSAPRPDAPTA
jgi:ammonium transporter, Amt family